MPRSYFENCGSSRAKISLPLPGKAAGAQRTHSRHGKVMTKRTIREFLRGLLIGRGRLFLLLRTSVTLPPVWFWGALHDRLAPTGTNGTWGLGSTRASHLLPARSLWVGWGVLGTERFPSSWSLVPATPVNLYVGRADQRVWLHGEGG